MKHNLIIFALAIFLINCNKQTKQDMTINYPVTNKIEQTDDYFGTKVSDPYRWLENDTSKETAEWVKAQNAVTFSYLEKIPYRAAIKDWLTKAWNYEKHGTPIKKAGSYFFFKNDGLQNQDVLYRMLSLDAEAVALLNPNEWSIDGTKALTGNEVSKDGKYIAYSVATGGSDWNEIFIKDIATGKQLDDHIQWVKFSGISWKGNGFYYSAYDAPKEGTALSKSNEYHKVFYHQLGTPQSQDQLVYQDQLHSKRNHGAGVTEDEKILILVASESTSGNALWFKDLEKKASNFVAVDEKFDYDYEVVDHVGGKLLVRTNYNAPKFKLIAIDVAKPARNNWVDIIPEKDDVLESVSLAGGNIIAKYIKDAQSKAQVYDLTGKLLHDMQLPGIGTMGSFQGNFDSDTAFYSFTSFTIPTVIYRYIISSNASEVFFKPTINIDFEKYETKQVFYPSKDGTKIPMFIVHKKGLTLDGTNPVLLYGYGGFNITLSPSFSVSRMVWLENGGVYALANLRGGGEYGREWHEAGTKLKKQNVFDDFIAAAEYLIKEKYTSNQKIAIMGGSNGGLLVGAVTNQRPDLFKVALPAVGVMDMLRYHKFTIGWAWASDYGTSEDSVDFPNLYKYSPLHTIREGVEYPAVLVTTADHDDRVVPAHSFKYISTLQEKYKGTNPVLIRIETMAGHGAGKPTAKIIEEVADIYAFTMYNIGMTPVFK